MNPLQSRLAAGTALIIAGIVVAVVGYLGVSRETVVAFQLPYFASAGVGALMLLGGGAAVLVTAQVERDTARLDELEDATRRLAIEVGRLADRINGTDADGPESAPAPRATKRRR